MTTEYTRGKAGCGNTEEGGRKRAFAEVCGVAGFVGVERYSRIATISSNIRNQELKRPLKDAGHPHASIILSEP